MKQITLNLEKDIAEKLNSYIQIFGNDNLFVDKFMDFQKRRLKKEIALMKIDLINFEKKYNKKSEVFYSEFQEGNAGDSEDFLLWSGIFEMYLDSKNKLSTLA